MHRLILPFVFLSVACEENKDNPRVIQNIDHGTEMSDFGGCGDFFVYAHNEDDSLSLQISGNDLISRAYTAGEAFNAEYDLSESNELEIVFVMGQSLNQDSCNDTIDTDFDVVIEEAYLPVSGTLSITIEASEEEVEFDGMPADTTIHLQSVGFCVEDHHENCFTINDLEFTTTVGWFPR